MIFHPRFSASAVRGPRLEFRRGNGRSGELNGGGASGVGSARSVTPTRGVIPESTGFCSRSRLMIAARGLVAVTNGIRWATDFRHQRSEDDARRPPVVWGTRGQPGSIPLALRTNAHATHYVRHESSGSATLCHCRERSFGGKASLHGCSSCRSDSRQRSSLVTGVLWLANRILRGRARFDAWRQENGHTTPRRVESPATSQAELRGNLATFWPTYERPLRDDMGLRKTLERSQVAVRRSVPG